MRTLAICFILLCFSIIFAADINIDTLKIIDLEDDIIDFEVFELDSEIIYTCRTETELYILSSDDTLSMPLTENYTLLQCHDDSILAVVEDSAFINYAHIYKVYPEIDFVSTVELPDSSVFVEIDSTYASFQNWVPIYDNDDDNILFYCNYMYEGSIELDTFHLNSMCDTVRFIPTEFYISKIFDSMSMSFIRTLPGSVCRQNKSNKYRFRLTEYSQDFSYDIIGGYYSYRTLEKYSIGLIDSICESLTFTESYFDSEVYEHPFYCYYLQGDRDKKEIRLSFYENGDGALSFDMVSIFEKKYSSVNRYGEDCRPYFSRSDSSFSINFDDDSVSVSFMSDINFKGRGVFLDSDEIQYFYELGSSYYLAIGNRNYRFSISELSLNSEVIIFDQAKDGFDEINCISDGNVYCLKFVRKIVLNSGWNMFSVIGNEEYYLLDEFLPSCEIAYYFDASVQSYVETDTLYPGKGYFILLPESIIHRSLQTGISSNISNLSPGWNMIGSLESSFNLGEIDSFESIIPPYYFYDGSFGYISVDTLLPFNAVWVLSTENCLIHIGE